jgi:diguanylate cyclase (GGDEF)-like protein
MSVLLLDTSGTVRDCVNVSLESQDLGPVHASRTLKEITGELAGALAVILDLEQDPDLKVCRQIRSANPSVPLIVLFDDSSAEHLEAALAAGATDCISKPLNPLEFCARLRSAANRRRLHEQESAKSSQPLTQLTGEPSFAESLDRAWRRDRRSQLPLSLLVINVDNLASYNRQCGRAEGDQCLRRIAAALRETVYRPDDVVANRGGGEFVVLLPATDCAGATVVAERLRSKVVELSIPYAGSSGFQQITVSIGAATADPSAEPSPEDLIAGAERALSRAKLEGRNRLVVEPNVAFCAPA